MSKQQSKLKNFIQKYKLGKLVNSCFVNFGVIFIGVNIVDMYVVVERPAFGGFSGQLSFGIIIAIAATYSPWNRQNNEKN